ncbi:hypothetical protein [Thiosocius teredinicola]|uniref:hypothetical protein n=1 Tax=Thiosocius teredinicola TaxID=1973002 RepID=UPI000990DC44
MNHKMSQADRQYVDDFLHSRIDAGLFRHREHVKIAYCLLTTMDANAVWLTIRQSLLALLTAVGADKTKYHETLTRAWVLAIDHFMRSTERCNSADEFIERNPLLLDQGIMLSHYSKQLLESETARTEFVDPDLEPIPRYRSKLA